MEGLAAGVGRDPIRDRNVAVAEKDLTGVGFALAGLTVGAIALDSGDLPLGESPYSLGAYIAWEDGFFADEKIDYSISVTKACDKTDLDFTLAWVGTAQTEGLGDVADDAFVFTVSKSM